MDVSLCTGQVHPTGNMHWCTSRPPNYISACGVSCGAGPYASRGSKLARSTSIDPERMVGTQDSLTARCDYGYVSLAEWGYSGMG